MHQHTWHGTLGETDPYPELRQLLAPELATLPPAEIESVVDELYGGEISAEQLENIWKKVGKIAKTAAPMATTALGTAFGGPLGGMLGGAVGNVVSGAIGQATQPRRGRPRRALGALKSALGRALPGGKQGGATAQLLQTLARPETLKALGAMALGPAGKPTSNVKGTPVPVTAFANLLGVLANQAAAEHHRGTGGETSGMPAYLLDDHGEAIGDPLDATSRAEALLGRLAEAAALDAAEADPGFDEPAEYDIESWEEALEAEEEFWSELALAEAEED